MSERVRIGELLVETGLISRQQLEQALQKQKDDPRRLGEIVVSEGMVSESKVTQILSQQLSVPWVSLEYVDFSRQLLNLVSSDTAQQHTLVPIYVRRSKQRRETLYVAIEDPSNQEALDEVADYSGLPVRPMIAPPSDIRAAIRAYYLGLSPGSTPPPAPVTPLPASNSRPPSPPAGSPPPPPPPPSAAARRPIAPTPTGAAPPPGALSPPSTTGVPTHEESSRPRSDGSDGDKSLEDALADGDQLDEDESSPESVDVAPRGSGLPTPSKPSQEAPKMVTLTMLDGTEVRLPVAPGVSTSEDAGSELTARDLVEALRAHAGGQDVSQVLGTQVDWQRMFAALLSLMLKKHLIMDWEFVRELKR